VNLETSTAPRFPTRSLRHITASTEDNRTGPTRNFAASSEDNQTGATDDKILLPGEPPAVVTAGGSVQTSNLRQILYVEDEGAEFLADLYELSQGRSN